MRDARHPITVGSMLTRIGYGLVLWVIPYVTAIPLLPLMKSDVVFFKTIMVVEGAIVGGVLTALYFLSVQSDFLKEGIVLAAVWIAVNWCLDVVALLPFTGLSLGRYFVEIGLRYVAIVSPTVAVGYVLNKRIRA